MTFTGTKVTGPTFCWHCNRQLRRAPGKGLFYFQLVIPPDGVPRRVHGACVKQVAL